MEGSVLKEVSFHTMHKYRAFSYLEKKITPKVAVILIESCLLSKCLLEHFLLHNSTK